MPFTRNKCKFRFYLFKKEKPKICSHGLFFSFFFSLSFALSAMGTNPIPTDAVPPTSFPVQLDFSTDCLPGQTSWQITDASENVVAQESYSGYAFPNGSGPHNYEFNLEAGCYTFTITDSGNNGMNSGGSFFCWNDGQFELYTGETVLAELEDPAFGASVSYSFCLEIGCTDPTASNYNENALADDGSCEYEAPQGDFTYTIAQSGCGSAQVNFEANTQIATELNWSVSGGSPSTGTGTSFSTNLPEDQETEVTLTVSNAWGSDSSTQTFTPQGETDGTSLDFVFEPDCWASETGWVLYNPDGAVIAELQPGEYEDEFPVNSTVHRTPLCVSNGCYTLEITDSYGDGIAGEMYNNCDEDGAFYIEDEAGEQFYVFEGNSNFGSQTSVNMCLTTHYTWRGTQNTNWNDAQNWQEGQVPEPNKSLIFDQVNYTPEITQDIEARDIIIKSGSQMNVDEYTVNVKGNIRIDGDISVQHGTLNLIGNGKHKLISNDQPTIHNLNVDVDTLEVLTPVTITGRLNIDNGVVDMKQNLITLVSDDNSTGSIGPLLENSELLTDKIRIQRYFPAGPAGWRMLCTSVTDATFEQWNDDFVTTGFEGSDYPNYGGADSPWSNIRIYNESVAGEGTDLDDGFESIGSVTDTIDHNRGYFVYMVPAPTMVEVEGNFHRGELNLPLTHTESGTGDFNDGWNLVANPYPSAISWDAASGWVRDGVLEAIYLFDPISGQYSSYVGGISNGSATAEIASGQAFWVKTNGNTDPQMVINELAKVSGEGVFMRNQPVNTETEIHIDLLSETTTDRAVIGFNSNATNSFDGDFDAFKFFPQNADFPSLCSYSPDSIRERMSINLFPTPTGGGEVDLLVKAGSQTQFTLRNSLVDAFDNNLCLTLEDRETGQVVVFNQGDEYEFETTDFPLDERFAIHFSAPLQVEVEGESCPEMNDGVAVSQGYGEAPWTYEWRDIQGDLISETSESQEPGTIEDLAPGYYTLTVHNQSELCPVASTTFEVTPAAEPNWEAEALAAQCNEELASSILVEVQEGYEWDFELQNGEGEQLDTFADISENFVIDSLSSGLHRLVATHNCSENYTTKTLAIRDENAPRADFSTSADTVFYSQGAVVSFVNESDNFETHKWIFGDGALDSLTQNPVHNFAEPGIYTVSLSVFGEHCEDEFSKTITVTDEVLSDESFASEDQEILVNYFSSKIEIATARSISQPVEVEVINSAGQLMISEKLNGINSSVTVPAEGLPAGVFWVNVRSEKKLLHTQRIVEVHR